MSTKLVISGDTNYYSESLPTRRAIPNASLNVNFQAEFPNRYIRRIWVFLGWHSFSHNAFRASLSKSFQWNLYTFVWGTLSRLKDYYPSSSQNVESRFKDACFVDLKPRLISKRKKNMGGWVGSLKLNVISATLHCFFVFHNQTTI